MAVPDLRCFIQVFRTWPHTGVREAALHRIRFVSDVRRFKKFPGEIESFFVYSSISRNCCHHLHSSIVFRTLNGSTYWGISRVIPVGEDSIRFPEIDR